MSKKNNTGKIDVDYLNELRESVNQRIDKQIEKAKYKELLESIDNMGVVNCFCFMTEMFNRLYDSPNGSRLIAKSVKELKENKGIRESYLLYERLTNGKYLEKVKDTDTYLNEALSLNKTEGNVNLDKYRSILKECAKSTCKTSDELNKLLESVNTPVNKAFTYLTENKKGFNNLVQWTDNINILKENVEGIIRDYEWKVNVNIEKLIDECENCDEGWKKDTLIDMITEEVAGGNNRKHLFEEYKKSCIENIDKSLNEDNKEEVVRLTEMKDKLKKKTFCGNTYYEDMMLMAELKNTFC